MLQRVHLWSIISAHSFLPAMAGRLPIFSTGTSIETANGARVYTPLSLKIYNVGVFGIVSPYDWRCPAETLVAFFNCNISQVTQPDPSSPSALVPRVLDIRVSTGYFLVCAPLTSEIELVLVDLNTDVWTITKIMHRASPSHFKERSMTLRLG